MGFSENIIKIYYEQLEWLRKLSLKFSDLKIVYKHHSNFSSDKIEEKIFQNSKIKFVIKDSEDINSYHYLLNSKIILSFGSTMILEALGLGKKSFFLDPENKNTIFFKNLDYLKSLRINKYDILEKVVQDSLLKKEVASNYEKEIFCLSHNNVSERIYNNINLNN